MRALTIAVLFIANILSATESSPFHFLEDLGYSKIVVTEEISNDLLGYIYRVDSAVFRTDRGFAGVDYGPPIGDLMQDFVRYLSGDYRKIDHKFLALDRHGHNVAIIIAQDLTISFRADGTVKGMHTRMLAVEPAHLEQFATLTVEDFASYQSELEKERLGQLALEIKIRRLKRSILLCEASPDCSSEQLEEQLAELE